MLISKLKQQQQQQQKPDKDLFALYEYYFFINLLLEYRNMYRHQTKLCWVGRMVETKMSFEKWQRRG